MEKSPRPIPWIAAGDSFPSLEGIWDQRDPLPGLLAAGGTLDVATLIKAYSSGIFPWFSQGQPPLWWSPNPRMVLQTKNFRLHRSLRKTLVRFTNDSNCEVRFDNDFEQVISACATKLRDGQPGTWIVSDMVTAYCALHRSGHAHSVETWVNGELVGGLYCVNLGTMIFGESMFAHQTDASKIALAALVAFCKTHSISMIDCQQNTVHLASMGAAEIERPAFLAHLSSTISKAAPAWNFEHIYWKLILNAGLPTSP